MKGPALISILGFTKEQLVLYSDGIMRTRVYGQALITCERNSEGESLRSNAVMQKPQEFTERSSISRATVE